MVEPSKRFDWDAAQKRLAALEDRLDPAKIEHPDVIRHVLEERARKYAAPPPGKTVSEEALVPLFHFQVDGARVAIEADAVAQITPYQPPAQIPCTPRHVRGLIHLKGQLVTVLDLAPLLWSKGQTRDPRWIVGLNAQGVSVALLADGIAGTRPTAVTEQPKANAEQPGWATNIVEGTFLVDINRLLTDSRVRVDEETISITGGDERGSVSG
ncbi:chemotaxis protein CheW [Oceanibaculum pacificum]|uniref:CheW-like domain-containing protein n=1 Tax=Oceanibaculum pacificum TaxID=580166 RepID=A0A154VY81_9PROT|nr:chemotaxis protein CheW [Oceanibaculum pacificum]KZD06198.1 hypothetical protein AUP43_11170 [Oceanibaculum pacificum]